MRKFCSLCIFVLSSNQMLLKPTNWVASWGVHPVPSGVWHVITSQSGHLFPMTGGENQTQIWLKMFSGLDGLTSYLFFSNLTVEQCLDWCPPHSSWVVHEWTISKSCSLILGNCPFAWFISFLDLNLSDQNSVRQKTESPPPSQPGGPGRRGVKQRRKVCTLHHWETHQMGLFYS